MALTIGSLVGTLRADASAWERGLDRARLRLAGLQRDADGRLRDMNGRFVTTGNQASIGLGTAIRNAANMAASGLKKVAPAVVGIGLGLPAVAAVTTALLGLAAGAVAAGLAVGAFKAAAAPQMEAVKKVADLAAKAEEAAAEGGEKAAAAQKAYTDALKELPPATQKTAKAFIGLKGDFKAWSDGLSGTTMPIFTKGIEILRDLLPMLTPFVKAAAGALGDMLDKVATGVKGARFKEWAADMAAASGPALKNLLTAIGNLGRGFMLLLQAFLPASAGMTGGLASMTGAFASWAAGLKGSEGFARFLEMARNGGGALGNLGKALLNLVVALSPLIGTTAMLANGFARIINNTPTPVLTALAAIIGTAVVAMKLWAVAQALVAVRNRIWTASQWQLNASMLANPVVLIVAGILALIAVIVLIATKTTWFQTAWKYTWNAVKAAAAAVWGWLKTAFWAVINGILAAAGWLARLPAMVGGWFMRMGALAINAALSLVTWLATLPMRILSALGSLGMKLLTFAGNAFLRFHNAVMSRASASVSWLRGLPGKIIRALGSVGSMLYGAGKSIIQGLINGIVNMSSAVTNAVGGVLKKARNLLPFSPAKEGPFSGKGWTLYSGRSMMTGLAQGIEQRTGLVGGAMARAAEAASVAVPGMQAGGLTGAPSTAGGAGTGRAPYGTVRVQIDLTGADEDLKKRIRKITKIDGRGNVQVAFGRT